MLIADKSTTKHAQRQTRRDVFNGNLKNLFAPTRKDISILIGMLLEDGRTIEEIATVLSKKNMPISSSGVKAYLGEK